MTSLVLLFLCVELGLQPVWKVSLEQIGILESHRKNLLTVAADGSLFLRDSANSKLLFLDSTGKPLRFVGGKGQGPGEFQRPEGLGFMDGKIVVAERAVNRLHFFDPNGKFLSSQTTKTFLRFPVFGPKQRIYCLKGDFSGYEPTILMFDLMTGEAKQIYASAMQWQRPRMVWSSDLLFAAGSDFVAVHESDVPKIRIINTQTAKTEHIFNLELPRRSLSDDSFKAERTLFLSQGRAKNNGDLKAKINQARPDFWPVLDQILVDDQNRIWAFLPSDSQTNPTEFTVYHKKGTPLFSGKLQGRVHAVVDGFLYALHEDANQDEYLTKYRMVER